jgi:hypothetical protein
MRRDTAEIGKHTDPAASGAEKVLAGLARIVRDHDGLYVDIADAQCLSCIETLHLRRTVQATAAQRAVSKEDRNVKGGGQGRHPTDVVAVFVRDEDRGQIPWTDAETLETGRGLPQGETAIDHEQRATALQKGRVTLAATAERRETH